MICDNLLTLLLCWGEFDLNLSCLKYWLNCSFLLELGDYFSFMVVNVHAKFQHIDEFWKGCIKMTDFVLGLC